MKMIVTNLRVAEHDWIQVKTIAGEMGMSANEYVNHLLQNSVSKAQFDYPKKGKTKKRKSFYDLMLALAKMAETKSKNKKYELSDDDKVIYGV